MNEHPPLTKDDYYEVPGIDLDGNPTTFKILITKPNQKNQEKKHHEQ